jgi:PilZ domain-containing protein
MQNERRRSDRKKTSLEAEMVLRGRTVPMRITTTDVSLGGCYIESMFTLPIGAHLTITLWIGEEKLKISGLVKTCDPVFGNGIEFVELPPLERFKLRAYLDSVNEE